MDEERLISLGRSLRRLLRQANAPSKIAADPLARSICRATGVDDVSSALRAVVDEALGGELASVRRQRAVLVALAFEGGTVSELSQRMGLSRRHVLRIKSDAIAALAVHACRVLSSDGAPATQAPDMSGNPFEDLAEMVAKVEPRVAATIVQIGDFATSARSQLLALRAKLGEGAELDERAYGEFPKLPHALVSAYIAFERAADGLEPLAQPPPSNGTFAQRQDDVTKFEIEQLAFLRARQSGRPLEMKAVASNLQRLAPVGTGAVGTALIAQADAALRLGAIDQARDLLERGERLTFHRNDVRPFAETILLHAKIALFEGDAALADGLARGAYAALHGHRDAFQCQVLIADCRFELDRRWSPPEEASNLRPLAWDRIAMDAQQARGFAQTGQWDEAQTLAESVRERASRLGYPTLAARAAATLALCARAAGSERRARERYLEALRGVFEANDFLLAAAVAAYPAGAPHGGLDVAGLVYRRLCLSIPQLLADTFEQRRAARRLVASLLALACDPAAEFAALDDAIEDVSATEAALAYFGARSVESIEWVLCLSLVALGAGRHWAGKDPRVRAAVEYVVSRMRAGRPRVFAV